MLFRSAVPLELKTGKLRDNRGSLADRAQVALYSLLFSERNIPVAGKEANSIHTNPFPEGVLCYINQDTTSQIIVHSSLNEIHGLIQRRNELVAHRKKKNLPPQIKDRMTCTYCNYQNACYIYHRTQEAGCSGTAAISSLWKQYAAHLSERHCSFFSRWDQFITWDTEASTNPSNSFWNFPSSYQQELGVCAGQLRLISSKLPTQRSSGSQSSTPPSSEGGSGFLYRFRQDGATEPSTSHSSQRTFTSSFLPSQSNEKNLFELQLSAGDYILLSTEHGHFGVRQGTIQSIGSNVVEVLLHEPLQAPYHLPSSFASALSSPNSQKDLRDIEDLATSRSHQMAHSTLWRIDKLESQNVFSQMRYNLLHLLEANPQSQRLRELIIDDKAPVFSAIDTPCDEFIHSWSQQCPSIGHLNAHQRLAIRRVVAAKDFALILGMPGTGKTTTIAHIVSTLVQKGKRVLLTSYTHSAVDNLLLKLLDMQVPFLRLGNGSKQHSSIAPHSLETFASIDSLKERLACPVIATTCLGVNDMVLQSQRFDYCIIDEASQISLPVCLGPLFFAQTFVLVGDHYQLPPIVKSTEAISADCESLFKLLSERRPESVVQLGIQYRMNSEIMSISNHLVYNNRLKCENEGVGKARIVLPRLSKLPIPVPPSDHWMLQILLPNNPVVFVDLDHVPALEVPTRHLITNPVEARITAMVSSLCKIETESHYFQIARSLICAGVKGSEIGIISPYRSQLKAIRQCTGRFANMQDVDIFTVDRYQGKDKEAIIFSLVRSNTKNKVGELLEDWRRANVAFTRAKTKLIILGSASTLSGNHFFSLFLQFVRGNGWMLSLPQNAHKTYHLRDLDPEKDSRLSQR